MFHKGVRHLDRWNGNYYEYLIIEKHKNQGKTLIYRQTSGSVRAYVDLHVYIISYS